MSHGLPTGPYAEFSVDDPIANSSQLVLPTHTAPASNSRCTAVPVYGGLNPRRIFEPAVVSMPSTQSTSLSAIGMPHSGDAVSGCSSSIRAAASACVLRELARDREVRVQVLLGPIDVRQRVVEERAWCRAAVAQRRGELGDGPRRQVRCPGSLRPRSSCRRSRERCAAPPRHRSAPRVRRHASR